MLGMVLSLQAQIPPPSGPYPILSNAQPIGGNTVQVCMGDSVTFQSSALNVSPSLLVIDSFFWDFNGAITTNPGNVSAHTVNTWMAPGLYPIVHFITRSHTPPFTTFLPSDPDTLWLLVVAPPSVQPTMDTAVCRGQGIALEPQNISNTDSIVWFPHPTLSYGRQDSVWVEPVMTTIYQYKAYTRGVSNGMASGFCRRSYNTVVTVLPPPLVRTIGNRVICAGDSVVLDVRPPLPPFPVNPVSYAWSTDRNFSTILTTTRRYVAYNITNSVRFYVQMTDGNGCIGMDSMEVMVRIRPTPPIADVLNDSVCLGSTIALRATDTSLVSIWRGPNGFTASSALFDIGAVSVLQTGYYTITTRDSLNCPSFSDSVFVAVFQTSVPPPILGLTTICEGDPLLLSAMPRTGSSLYWRTPNGDSLGGNNLMIQPDSSAYLSGTWTLWSRNSAGCESRRDTPVIIEPAPILTNPLGTVNICAGDDLRLDAPTVPNVTLYNWLDTTGNTVAQGQNTFLYNLNQDTLLVLEVTMHSGCRYILDSLEVQVNNRGAAPRIFVDTMACIGERNTIFSTDTATGYYWRRNGQAISYQDSFLIDTIRVSDAGLYVLSVIDANGCISDSATVNFVVNRRPAIPTVDSFGLICRGEGFQLSGPVVSGLTAIWRSPNGTTLDDFSIWISPDSSYYSDGVWLLIVRDSITSCRKRSMDVQVQIQNRPNIVVGNSGPVCLGQTAVLTAADSTASGMALNYIWYRDIALSDTVGIGTTITINNIQGDSTFYAIAINSVGCISTVKSTTVILRAIPPPPNLPDSLIVCEGDVLTLGPSPFAATYQWAGPNNYSSNLRTPTIPSIQTNQAGSYSLVVTPATSCPSFPALVNVLVNPVPAAPIAIVPIYLCANENLILNTDSSSHCNQLNWIGPNTTTFPLTGNTIVIPPGDTNYIGGFWSVECQDSLTGCVSRSVNNFLFIAPLPDTPRVTPIFPVCQGDSVTLSVSSGSNTGDVFSWYADSTLQSFVDSGRTIQVGPITSNTIYYLRVTNFGGCVSTVVPVPVTVYNTTPPPMISPNTSYCEGDVILLSTTSSSFAYDWSSNTGWSSTDSIALVTNQANASHTGTYSLRIKDSNGCWSPTTTLTLTVNSNPIPPIARSNSPICDGTPLTLRTTANCGRLEWYGPSGVSSSIIFSNDADYFDNSQWLVECMDTTTGCSALSNTITVTINESPSIDTLVILFPNCVGDTLWANAQASISSNNPLQYSWYKDSTRTIFLGGQDSLVVVNILQGFSLYLVVTDTITGCENTAMIPITVNQLPATPTIGGRINYCVGEDLLLFTTAPASQYYWTGPNGWGSAAPQLQRTLTLLDSGTYYLSVVDNNGCFSPIGSTTVTVNPLPDSFVAYTGGGVCVGQDAMLLIGGGSIGSSYDWYQLPSNQPVGTGTNLLLSNVQASDSAYYYAVAVLNGCTLSSDSVLLPVYAPSAIAEAGPNQLLCGWDTTSVFAQGIPTSVAGIWTSSSAVAIQQPNAVNTAVGPLPLGRHVFYWTLSNATCSNFAVDSVVIEVLPPTSEQAMAGPDQRHCGNSFLNLAATAPQIGIGCWTQSNIQSNTGVIIIDSLYPTTGLTGLQTGQVYQFIWQLKNGRCGVYSTDTMELMIDSLPTTTAFAGIDQNSCLGDSLVLQALGAPNGQTGNWTPLNGGTILSPNQASSRVLNLPIGTHQFVWTLSTSTCPNYSSDTVTITVIWPQPIAEADYFVLLNANSTIDVSTNDLLPNSWTIDLQQSIDQGQLTNLNTGEFTVTLSSVTSPQSFIYELCDAVCVNSCDTALVLLSVEQLLDCPIPNIFTPNNDGVNDQFEVPCVSEQQPAYLVVYNRWGDEVYKSDSYVNQWDGTHLGAALPDGTYFYVLQLTNGNKTQGSVEIRR